MKEINYKYKDNQFYRSITVENPERTILFIHGLGESGLCFEQLALALQSQPDASKWNILIPDLKGYGRSLPEANPVSLKEYAKYTIKMAKSLVAPVVLIGHSMGGVIGQLAVETDKSAFAGFINIEGNLTAGDCVFSGQAAEYSLQEFLDHGFDVLKETVYENGTKHDAQKGYYASMRFAEPRQFYLNSNELTEFSSPDTAAKRFATLEIPSLYIGGSPRGICKQSVIGLHTASAPVVFIEDSGHWPFIDHVSTSAEIVNAFLKKMN